MLATAATDERAAVATILISPFENEFRLSDDLLFNKSVYRFADLQSTSLYVFEKKFLRSR